MMALHCIEPARVLATINNLEAPANVPTGQAVDGSERRIALAVMLGLAVGLKADSAQQLVDQDRGQKLRDVASFVAQSVVTLTMMGAGWYGSTLVICKAASGVAAKAVALKGGGLGLTGLLKSAAICTGYGAFALGATVVGAFVIVGGARKQVQAIDDHRNLFEPRWFKNRRVLVGLKERRVTWPNDAPMIGRPQTALDPTHQALRDALAFTRPRLSRGFMP